MSDQIFASWYRDYPKCIDDNPRPFFTPETPSAQMEWVVALCLQASLKAVLA